MINIFQEHRIEYWQWVEKHAVPDTRDVLLHLRDHWHAINVKHFDGAMVLPYITLTHPSTPNTFGQCWSLSSWGSRLEIRLRPSLLDGTHPRVESGFAYAEGRFRFVADVLTHEAIHQWQQEITGKHEDSYHGHGPTFREKANEIGETWGLPPVVVKNRNGSREKVCAHWPHNVRPVEYYLGAYPVPVVRDRHCPTCTCRNDSEEDFTKRPRKESAA